MPTFYNKFTSVLNVNNVIVWIVVFFFIRLIGITNPPLEYSHSWRQVTGTMVARNFLESDPNIFYPRIDDTHGGTGIIGMEFPLLNYLIYLVSHLFGYTHWYGRLINLCVSSFGSWFFFLIVRHFIDPRLALTATIIFLASMWFSFSRKIMPDTFSFSLAMVSLYYGLVYLRHGHTLILFMIFFCLATLSKIPSIFYPIFLIIPLINKNILFKRKLLLLIGGIFSVIPAVLWYYYWCPYLSNTYGNWYNGGQGLIRGFCEVIIHPNWAAHHFYYDALRSVGFVAFAAGVILVLKRRQRLLSRIFLLSVILFVVFIFKSGHFFLENDYYILLYIPVMCLMAAYGIESLIHRRWKVFFILVIVAEGLLTRSDDLLVPEQEVYKLKLEKIADSLSQPSDLIAINGSPNPQMLYLSHRKGWVISDKQAADHDLIQDLSKKGCRYLIIDRKQIPPTLPYRILYSDGNFIAYRIQE